MSELPDRGSASTALWEATCKDCQGERTATKATSNRARGSRDIRDSGADDVKGPRFEYSSEWVERMLDRGNSRSDRCERHRKAHRLAIQALAVPYINLSVIGEVLTPEYPTGPLGSLGPLPVLHKERTVDVDLSGFEFGMTDRDVLEILEGLREKQVAVIEAGTGTGKSTFMPFRLMNPPPGSPFRLSKKGPIVVTEPRVAAAKGVARFVGEELCFAHDSRKCSDHIGPGYAVGYQVKGEKHWDAACQLIYVTDGTMINWVRDGQLSRIGAVVIDEAHERSENIDIILAQLRATIRNHKHLRVIITSATLDRNFFVEYFGGSAEVFHMSVPPTKTFGYGVPLFIDAAVSDDVIADGLAIGAIDATGIAFEGWSTWGPEQNGYPPENLREATHHLQTLRCVEEMTLDEWKERMPSAVARQVVAIAKGTEWGDILSFLPTTASIDQAVTEINDALAGSGLKKSFDVYPLLATTDKSISDKATAARSRGQKRKIVVSSNLAETSLTVKGVRYVVDSGLICQPEWDPQLASGSYPTKPHSQSGVRQRWGRVGRDAPGWVFPLYTADQFLSLPRSTPPGSAQTNLEGFYMKLIAAGVNVEEAALPANFRHESITPDADAVRVIETFTRESVRAQRALRLAGAIDGDGDLTEYGRDLERFPGTGSEALALMLAEQLACIHEVALALHVLGQGRLIGKKNSCVLQIDQEWPAAWRVAAAQRHRGLAFGCIDDLDVLLRVCAIWQSADDRAEWCATWWVNAVALDAAWTAAMDTVKSLSAAMKGEAFRRIEPRLAGRVRAVLTRAMVSLRYERVSGTQFRALTTGPETAETVTLSRSQLLDTGDRILAFNRFRPSSFNDDEPRQAYISHAVRVVEWAETTHGDPDDMGLDLIVRAASHVRDAPDPYGGALESIEQVRAQLPIGTLVELALEGSGSGPLRIVRADVSQPSFQRPRTTGARLESPDTESGFDPDWDPIGASAKSEVPEEERLSEILDPRASEVNDTPTREPRKVAAPTQGVKLPSLPALYAISAWESAPLSASMHGRIVGYGLIEPTSLSSDETARPIAYAGARTRDPELAIAIEPLRVVAPVDPAEHADLRCGQELDVRVCGVISDYEREYLQLARTDGMGYFYAGAATGGLSYYDRTFLTRLAPGAVLPAVVVTDETDEVTITLLPAAHANLRNAPTESLQVGNAAIPFYGARICELANSWGKVRVELEHGQSDKALSHQFEIRQQDLRSAQVPEVLDGPLLVALERDRARSRSALKIRRPSGKLDAFLRAHSDTLMVTGERIELGSGDLSRSMMAALQEFDDSPQWRSSVWAFYTASLRRSVRAVRPPLMREYVTCRPAITSLLRERKRDFQERYDVVLLSADPRSRIEIRSPNQAASAVAAAALKDLNGRPCIVAALPPGTAGIVLGREHSNRKRLEAHAGVLWIWIDDDRVGIVGETDHAVEMTLQAIRSSVEKTTGELVVPAGKMGLLIGRKGATIQRLKDSTGCQARNPDNGNTWIVEGPSEASVSEFLRMARQIVGGTSRIVTSRTVKIVENTTKGTQPTRRAEKRPAPKPQAEKGGPCFVATACYGSGDHPDVVALRLWRDQRLLRSYTGQAFVRFYYRWSPFVARYLEEREEIARIVRIVVLRPIARLVRTLNESQSSASD